VTLPAPLQPPNTITWLRGSEPTTPSRQWARQTERGTSATHPSDTPRGPLSPLRRMLTLLSCIAFGPACYDSPACYPTAPLEGAELCAALDAVVAAETGEHGASEMSSVDCGDSESESTCDTVRSFPAWAVDAVGQCNRPRSCVQMNGLDTASACADGDDVVHSVECWYQPQW